MKFTCEKRKLLDAVSECQRAITKKLNIAYSGVYFAAEDGKLSLTSTDADIWINIVIDVDLKKSGSFLINARLLSDILRYLPEGEVDLEDDDIYVTIKAGKSKYSLRTIVVEDFPQKPIISGRIVAEIDAVNLSKGIEQVRNSSAKDERRPVLTGIKIETDKENKELRMVATDNYRIAVKRVQADVKENIDFIIPHKTMNEVMRVVRGKVTLISEENMIEMKSEKMDIISRVIEGKFPNYKQLIPEEIEDQIIFNKEELSNSIKRINALSETMKIGFEENNMIMEPINKEHGEGREELDIDNRDKKSVTIGFKNSFLEDGVSVIEGEKGSFMIQEENKPVLMRQEKEDNFIYVIMPVKVR